MAAAVVPPTTVTLPYTLQHPINPKNALARPLLWLDVFGPGGLVRAQGIVDSGADRTSFPLPYGALLGYGSDVEEKDGRQAGGGMTYYEPKPGKVCHAQLPGDPHGPFPIQPIFVVGAQMILWGRLDFFRAWGVAFSETAQQFTIVRSA